MEQHSTAFDLKPRAITMFNVHNGLPSLEKFPLELIDHIFDDASIALRCKGRLQYDKAVIMTKATNGHDTFLTRDFEVLAGYLTTSDVLENKFGLRLHPVFPLHLKLNMVIKKGVTPEDLELGFTPLGSVLPISKYEEDRDGCVTVTKVSKVQSRGVYLSINCDATSFSLDPQEAETGLYSADSEPSHFDWIVATADDEFAWRDDTENCTDEHETPLPNNPADDADFWQSFGSAHPIEFSTVSKVSNYPADHEDTQSLEFVVEGGCPNSEALAANNEEVINGHILSSFDMEDLRRRLALSHCIEDLVIFVKTDIDVHGDQEQELHTGRINTFHDALVDMVEQMTGVTRYIVQVNRFATFGSRKQGQTWADNGVQKVSHQAGYLREYWELLKDLHVGYEPTGKSGNCVCGCVGAQHIEDEVASAYEPIIFDFW